MIEKGKKSLRKWGKNVGDFQNFVGVFSENDGLFQNFVGDFPKNVGDFSANVGVFGAWCRRKPSKGGAAVGKSVERCAPVWCSFYSSGAAFTPIWCSFHTHLVQLSRPSGAIFAHLVQSFRPSGATFAPIWCSLPPIWCNLRPKEGSINKPSALGLVGKICIFAATSCRCGAHTIALSRVPRKALLTLRGLYPSCDYRLALTTSIYTLP